MTAQATSKAVLALADGTIFRGVSIGAIGETVGEVVFNTAMTGYQEILTDPSYAGQMVTLTYPHIGNTGCNDEDRESGRIHKVWATGLIIRDLPLLHSNFRATGSLSDYLIANNVVAIADIDTRKLTTLLRTTGAQNGCIMTADSDGNIDEARAIELAKSAPSMKGQDLAKVCCDQDGYIWTEGSWSLPMMAVMLRRPRPAAASVSLAKISSTALISWLMTLASKPTSCVCLSIVAVMSLSYLRPRLWLKY